MVCYASVGGSGVVATELAHALAKRGHEVHVISSEPPFRWRSGVPGLSFERVEVPTYPLFHEPQYLLALATSIARVVEARQLDIVHAHYAVPHATAAYLSRQILSSSRATLPRTVTTLHGTDITVVGSDPSYRRVVAFSIEQSHGVTAVSHSLKADTIGALGITHPIDVIPNFLDCEVIALLAEWPSRAFGFKLRADAEEPTRREMLDLLRSAFIADRPVRLDYVNTGPRVGEIIRVASGETHTKAEQLKQDDFMPWKRGVSL